MKHYLDAYLQSLKGHQEVNKRVRDDWQEEAAYKHAAAKRADDIVARLTEQIDATDEEIRKTEEQIKGENSEAYAG